MDREKHRTVTYQEERSEVISSQVLTKEELLRILEAGKDWDFGVAVAKFGDSYTGGATEDFGMVGELLGLRKARRALMKTVIKKLEAMARYSS